MIRISRTALPDKLRARLDAAGATIAQQDVGNQVTHARRAWRGSTARAELATHLKSMAPGLEQCMYCGESIGTAIDHFEPLSRNPLRTFDWLNHVLACTLCNSNFKRDRFPLDAHGQPLLIDPTAEDPFDHLMLTLSLGEYRHLTAKGEASIEVFGLNRGVRPRGRQLAREPVEMLLRCWIQADAEGDGEKKSSCVRDIQDQPFADVCQAMLRQAGSPNASIIFGPDILAALLREDLRRDLLR